jgi:hydrogenase maturation factor
MSQVTDTLSTLDFMTLYRELDMEYIMEKGQQVGEFVVASSASILSIISEVASSLGAAAGGVADFVVFVGTLLVLLEVYAPL